MAYILQANKQTASELRRIVIEQIDQAMSVHVDKQLHRDAAVHQARQQCKKLRAVLQLMKFGNVLPDLTKFENARIRDAAAKLANLRDAQAVLKTFDEFRQLSTQGVSSRVLNETSQVLSQRRASIHSGAQADGWIEGFIVEMGEARRRANLWKLDQVRVSDLMRGFAKSHRRSRKAMRACRRSPTDETYHDWRKWSKYQLYQSLLLEQFLTRSIKRRVSKLNRLGKLLGVDHDLAVLRHELVQSPDFNSVRQLVNFGELLCAIDNRRKHLQTRSLRIGKRVYKKGFTSRLTRD